MPDSGAGATACPICSATLPQADDCRVCGARFRLRDGVFDFRQTCRDFAAAASPAPALDWAAEVRAQARASADADAAVQALASAGNYAWKLLLNLSPDAVLLDLGCGPGSRASGLAPHVAACHAVETDVAALRLAARRLTGLAAMRCVLVDRLDRLPYAAASFDLLVLPDWSRRGAAVPSLPALLREAARVLKPDGQLFLLAANRYGYPRLAQALRHPARTWRGAAESQFLSLHGYRAALRRAGLSHIDLYECQRGRDFMHGLRPLAAPRAPWQPGADTGLKQRIKQHRALVPCFGIVASRAGSAASMLSRLIEAAGNALGDAGQLRMHHLEFSRKDKLIMLGRWRDESLVLRVPLAAEALRSEQGNARALRVLAGRGPALGYPRSLANGELDGHSYFVESFVAGEPLVSLLPRCGREGALEYVRAALDTLNPPTGAPPPELTGERYDLAVSRRLHELASLIADPARIGVLEDFFHGALYGQPLPEGLTHGDFSVSNLLIDARGGVGLIDWESADPQGLPVIDLLNYFDSAYRHSSRGAAPSRSIPALARRDSLNTAEQAMLDNYYARHGIAPQTHYALSYLKWLHHVSYLSRYWLPFNERALRSFVFEVLEGLLRDRPQSGVRGGSRGGGAL